MSEGYVSAADAVPVRPATLREAVRSQYTRAFHPPFDMPIVVASNGLFMTGCWFLLPNPNPLFTFHGALAFPMVLASWMFSDVPATNVLGSDAMVSITALQDPRSLLRMLLAKNFVLWTLIAPFCAVIAIILGLQEDRPTATIFTIVWILVVPWGTLPLAAWAGIYYPYHPIALRDRWRHRRQFKRMILRWGILVVLPYMLVPAIVVIISAPTLLLWYLTSHTGGWSRVSDGDFAVGVLIGCGLAAVACLWGYRRGVRIAEKRKPDLILYLGDPRRG